MSPSSPHLLAARHVLNFRSVRKRERERECIGFGTNGDWEGESVWKRQWLWVCVCVCAHVFVCVCVYLGVASDSPVLIILAKKLNVLSEESDLNCFYQGFVTSLRISKKIQKMHFCRWVGLKKLTSFWQSFLIRPDDLLQRHGTKKSLRTQAPGPLTSVCYVS